MPKYQVELSDGRRFVVESDGPPSEQDILASLGESAEQTATPPPAAATAGMPAPSLTTDQPQFQDWGDIAKWRAGEAGNSIKNAAGIAATVMGPGILGMASRAASPVLRAAGAAAGTKTGGAVIGAAEEGLRTKGDLGSMARGAALGALGSGGVGWIKRLLGGQADDAARAAARSTVAQGMSTAGKAAADPTLARARQLEQLLNTGSLEDISDFIKAGKPATAAARPVVKAAGTSDDLAKELLAREIDWRTVDAVPIDAMQRNARAGGSIIEPGESRVALGELMAKAQKMGDRAEVDRLSRAIRQRQHIEAKVKGR